MDEVIAVVGEDPLGGVVAFEAVGQIAVLALELEADFVGDGLGLARVGAGADYEMVGEGSDAGKVEDDDVDGLFFTCGADGGEPGWFRDAGRGLVWYWTGEGGVVTNAQIRFLEPIVL